MKYTKRKLNIIAPVILWIVLSIVFMIRYMPLFGPGHEYYNTLKKIALSIPLDIACFYLYYSIFGKGMLADSKNRRLFISLAAAAVLILSVIWVIYFMVLQDVRDFRNIKRIFISSIGHTIIYGGLGILLRISVNWFTERDKRTELEIQSSKSELALLKSQLSPHFIFNTLNNINWFTSSDPKVASDSIIKLSEIMRYMLYEASAEIVTLSKEIDYINNYLTLQRLRYNNPDFIRFRAEGNQGYQTVAPLLFVPFIENAFKHGKKNIPFGIDIKLEYRNNEILFRCKNIKAELTLPVAGHEGGVGLANIRRRLYLLYPCRHIINIIEDRTTYVVTLKIFL